MKQILIENKHLTKGSTVWNNYNK